MPKIDKIQKFLNKCSKYSQDAFKSAAQAGRKDVVERLIEQGIDVNKTDEYGKTALHSAAENGHTKLVKSMIEKGADVNQSDTNARTDLHYSAEMGHKDIIELLLPKMTPDAINQADAYDKTALHYAAGKGHTGLVKWMIEKGADVNQANNISGETALHYAARNANHDMVKLLIESGKCDLNAKERSGNDIWTYYPPDQESSIGMLELLMKHGAKYPEPRRSDGELAKIVSSSQSGHSQGKLAQDEYNKFKEGKDDANIRGQLEAQANEFIKLLNSAHLSLSEEYHIKMVKDLIGPKYADIETGQGTKFIIDVSRFAGFEISEDLETQLLNKDDRKDIKSDLEKLGINPENLKNAIDNLPEEKRKELAQYSQDKIDKTISYYTDNVSKPFYGFDVTTKDFFGVFGAKIAEKIEKKEDIGDILPNTLKEILDAGTMYGSAKGASCATGMVNKMFNSSPQLFEDKIEVVKKGEFEFEGFVVDYEALLTVATMKLEDSKEEELVEKILGQSELTQLEVQKVGAKVYEILKETNNNENLVKGYKNSWTFSEIVNYGEENVFTDAPKKIEQFGKALASKTLSDQTYSGLFKKHGEEYKINQDKVKYPLTKDDLEVDITPENIMDLSSDIGSDHDITMSGVDAYNNEDPSM